MSKKTIVAGLGLAGLAWALRDLPAQFGAKATGARAERMRNSPQYSGGVFHNSAATRATPSGGSFGGLAREFLFGENKRSRRPGGEIPLVSSVTQPVDEGLYLTWFGHASTLVEI